LVSSCAKEKKKEDLSFDELKKSAFACIQKNKNDEAADFLEQIVTQHQDHPDLSKYKMILAGLYFKLGRYPSAYELYENFNQFYPSDNKAEYAKYRAILAKFYQTLRTDCDQTATEETTKLCKEYIQNPIYNKYATDVKDILNTCEHKLVDKEVYVYNFYLNKGKITAARNRLKYIKDNFQKQALEPRFLYLECKLAQKEKNISLVKKNIETLLNKYPESQFTNMAQALVSKPTFLF
jgi:outer membrane assembly lipoprotein YfiO